MKKWLKSLAPAERNAVVVLLLLLAGVTVVALGVQLGQVMS